MAHPLPQIDFDAMTSARMTSITMASDSQPPLFIDTTLLVEEFIAYYQQYYNNSYDGIRFYPQYENDGKLYNAICVGKLGADTAFCLLKDVDYTLPGNSFVNIVPSSTVQSNLETYRDNILIEDNPQDPSTYLRSRFFDWTSIESFFAANINGFDINNPATYSGYTLKIKIAFTNETLSTKFHNTYHIGSSATEQIGFTVAISLVDPTGNLLINPALPYQAGEFGNRYLEMATTCPSRCGSL
jgi:hypothetical protein